MTQAREGPKGNPPARQEKPKAPSMRRPGPSTAPTRALSRFRGYRYAGVLGILSLHIEPYPRERASLGALFFCRQPTDALSHSRSPSTSTPRVAGVPGLKADPTN